MVLGLKHNVTNFSASLLNVDNMLDSDAPNVAVTLNQFCLSEYSLTVIFGIRRAGDTNCEKRQNRTELIAPDTTEEFFVDTNTLMLQDGQEYCLYNIMEGM